jgi:sulfur-oxidizing protein SoxX
MFRITGGGVSRTGMRIGLAAALVVTLGGAGAALALKCTPKTAGFFKQLEEDDLLAPRRPATVSTARREMPSLTGGLGDPNQGRLAIINPDKGNCIACHRVAALSSEPAHGDLGVPLNGVGNRYSEGQLRQIVADPKVGNPNTVMPSFHVTEGLARVPAALAGQPILSAAEVEDVVAFLKTLR